MVELLENVVVRIFAHHFEFVGMGFLLANSNMVVTCAHIVHTAFDLVNNDEAKDRLFVDFPFIDDKKLEARVLYLHDQWQDSYDIAILHIQADFVFDRNVPALVNSDNCWGHSFRSIGFTRGYKNGIWVTGEIRGQNSDGLLQIEGTRSTGYWFRSGFSGTPVWDEHLNGIVGMLVSIDANESVKTAYMMPLNKIAIIWHDFASYLLNVSDNEYVDVYLKILRDFQALSDNPVRFQSQIDLIEYSINKNESDEFHSDEQSSAAGIETESSKDHYHWNYPRIVAASFKNRQSILEEMDSFVANRDANILIVEGIGGIGKTASVVKLIQDYEQKSLTNDIDGVVFLSTRTVGINIENLFGEVVSLLPKIQEEIETVFYNKKLSSSEKIFSLVKFLNTSNLIIVFDNFEDLLSSNGTLKNDEITLFINLFHQYSQFSKLIITSRVLPQIKNIVYRSDRIKRIDISKGIPDEDSRELLFEFDFDGLYGIKNASSESISELISNTYGIPRVLEIVIGLLSSNPFLTIEELISETRDEDSVVHVFVEENYKKLDGISRRIIDALAVYKKPVLIDAIEHMLSPFLANLSIHPFVMNLARSNIVKIEKRSKKISLHPIDQDYAYTQLSNNNGGSYSLKSFEARAAEYYRLLKTHPDTWKKLEDIQSNLQEFEHLVRSEQFERANLVISEIDKNHLFWWGFYSKLLGMRKKIIPVQLSVESRVDYYSRLGSTLIALGDAEKANKNFKKALEASNDLSDPFIKADCLNKIGLSYRALGQAKEALKYCIEAFETVQNKGNRKLEGEYLGNIGLVHHVLGNIEDAIEYYKCSHAIAVECKDVRKTSHQLSNLGMAYLDLGAVQKPINLFTEALEIARNIGNLGGIAIRLANLGNAYRVMGKTDKAILLFDEAIDIIDEIGNRRRKSIWLNRLGLAHLDNGDGTHALKLLEEALRITQDDGNARSESIRLNSIGLVCSFLGQLERALECFRRAIAIASKVDDSWWKSQYLLNFSKVLLSVGEISDAGKYCSDAIELNKVVYHKALLFMGIIDFRQSKYLTASRRFSKVIEINQKKLSASDAPFDEYYILALAQYGQIMCTEYLDDSQPSNIVSLDAMLHSYLRATEVCNGKGVLTQAKNEIDYFGEVRDDSKKHRIIRVLGD